MHGRLGHHSAIMTMAIIFALAAMVAPPLHRPAQATVSSGLTAVLDGRTEIDPREASNYYCHDFAYPTIRCYSEPNRLEADVQEITAPAAQSGWVQAAAAYGPNDYVTVYEHSTYSGHYMHLSQNYDALWVIGWNDRITAYKARNGYTGRFYEHWYYGGIILNFCCNRNVGYVGSTYDDIFSSVKRT